MNKVIMVGFAALAAAGVAGAQTETMMVGLAPNSARMEPEVSVEDAILSSYVWRGQVQNNDMVTQPQITVAYYDFSVNVWGNYNFGKDYNGVSGDFSEIDLSLAYDVPVNISDMSLTVGAIHYTFPNTMAEATTELYVAGTINTFQDLIVPVIPSVTVFGDVDEVKGTYVLFDVNVPYAFSDVLKVTGGVSAGYGNTSYNDYYFPNGAVSTQDAGWNDFNLYGIVDYEILEDLTASLSLVYTGLEGGSIESAAKDVYDAKEKFWGGVNVAYDF